MQPTFQICSLKPYWRALKVLILAILVSIIALCFVFAMFAGVDKETENAPLLVLISYVVITSIIYGFTKWRLCPKKEIFTLSKIDYRETIRLILIFIPFTIIMGILSSIINLPSSSEDFLMEQFKLNRLIFFVLIVVVAPILEELIFRGVVLNYLLENTKPIPAILFSSLLFGLIHFSPNQMVFSFFGGVFLGYVYIQSSNVLMPILFHALNNGLVFLGLIFFN